MLLVWKVWQSIWRHCVTRVRLFLKCPPLTKVYTCCVYSKIFHGIFKQLFFIFYIFFMFALFPRYIDIGLYISRSRSCWHTSYTCLATEDQCEVIRACTRTHVTRVKLCRRGFNDIPIIGMSGRQEAN